MGHEFLRHIERTRILVHILDIMPTDASDPVSNYEKIRSELALYSDELARKKEVIVLNKVDLDPDGLITKDITDRLNETKFPVAVISAVSGAGVNELNETLWKMVKEIEE